MRHDYDLPPDWDALSDIEKSKWMTRERCRRQAKKQGTPERKKVEHVKERAMRRLEARGYESVRERR